MDRLSDNGAAGAGLGTVRRHVLKRSGLLGHAGEDGPFERLLTLLQAVLGTPVVVVSLCDEDDQVIVAQKGLPPSPAGAAQEMRAFCAEALRRGRPFSATFPDSSLCARLGVPLKLADGGVVGVLASADSRARCWSEIEIGHVLSVAAILGETIETRVSEAKWRMLFVDMQESVYVAEGIRDPAGRLVNFRYLDANPAFERMPGRAGAVGRTVRDLLPAIADRLVEDYRCVVEEGRPMLTESLTDGEWYEVRARPLDEDRFCVVFHNISERKRTQMGLAEIDERRRLAIETGEVGILDLDLASRTVEWDERGARFHGLAPGRTRLAFEEIARALHPSDRAELKTRLAAVTAGKEGSLSLQYRFTGIDDHEVRWLFMNATVTQDADGRPSRLVGAVRDVSHRVEMEERRTLLNAELSHRLKNTLAIVSSIITQTLRSASDLGSARKALGDRIQALSKTHDILLSGQREGARIDAVIAAALSVHDEEQRVAIEGPRLSLGPKASLSLSLIVHELATNAGKYGALSVPGGHVSARWRVIPCNEGGSPLLVFDWIETDGPPVEPPQRRSFGTRLVEMGLSGAPEAEASITYAREGVRCRIVAPMSELATAEETRDGL